MKNNKKSEESKDIFLVIMFLIFIIAVLILAFVARIDETIKNEYINAENNNQIKIIDEEKFNRNLKTNEGKIHPICNKLNIQKEILRNLIKKDKKIQSEISIYVNYSYQLFGNKKEYSNNCYEYMKENLKSTDGYQVEYNKEKETFLIYKYE